MAVHRTEPLPEAPYSLDLLADLHAGVLSESVSERLWPLVRLDDAEIVFGVLKQILGPDAVARRGRIACQLEIFIVDLGRISPDFHFRTIAFKAPVRRISWFPTSTALTLHIVVPCINSGNNLWPNRAAAMISLSPVRGCSISRICQVVHPAAHDPQGAST